MTTAAMAEPATTNGHEEVVEAVQEEAMKDTADSAPATPPVEDVKPVYVVRLPRPDVDETSQKVLQTEIDIHMGKIKLLNEHMNIKRVSFAISSVPPPPPPDEPFPVSLGCPFVVSVSMALRMS